MAHVLFQFIFICGAVFVAAQTAEAEKKAGTRVECCGKLRCNNVGVAGASPGTTVSFDGVIWELRLPDDKSKKFAHDHHKDHVKVSGTLTSLSGKGRKEIWIVDVAEMTLANPNPKPTDGATIEIDGTLEQDKPGTNEAAFSVRSNDNVKFPIDVSGNATLNDKAKTLTSKKVKLVGRVEKIEGVSLPAKFKVVASQLDAAAIR